MMLKHTSDTIGENHADLSRVDREALTCGIQADAEKEDVATEVEPDTEPPLDEDDSVLSSILHIDPRLGLVQELKLVRSVSNVGATQSKGDEPLDDRPGQTIDQSEFLDVEAQLGTSKR
jgi:hypothetical protein